MSEPGRHGWWSAPGPRRRCLAVAAALSALAGCAPGDEGSDWKAPTGDATVARQAVTAGYGGDAAGNLKTLARDEVRCYLAYIEMGAAVVDEQESLANRLIAEAQYTLYAAYIVELADGKGDEAALRAVRELRAANREDVANLALSPSTAGPLLRGCESRRHARQITIKPFTAPTLKDATTDRI